MGKDYVHTILGDRSRFLVMAFAYRRRCTKKATCNLWWVFKGGWRPKVLYVDNGNCFVSKGFGDYWAAQGISVIYARGRTIPEVEGGSSGSTAP